MKNFTSKKDVSNVSELLDLALKIKENPHLNPTLGKNKTLGLIFFNPSLRTRLSTQKAAQNIGLNVLSMNIDSEGWKIETELGAIMNQGTQEHIIDAAGVLSQYCDIIGVRIFPSMNDQQSDYEEKILNLFKKHLSCPLISLESSTLHPLQSFADLITIETNKTKKRPKVVLTWVPHVHSIPQAVANSFSQWMSESDVDFVIANPVGFDLSTEFTNGVQIVHSQVEALTDADFVYAKNWASFSNYGFIGTKHHDWKLTPEKMSHTNNGKFMHCLPIRRNIEVSDEVIDGQNSLVMEQVRNRTVAAQTILTSLLNTIEQ
jgi:N-succinyl-L-ornithine transcarbamylase